MRNDASAHLSDEQLAQYQDGELPARETGHLTSCAQCGDRLRDMEAAAAVYVEYRDSIRGPMLPPAPKPWARFETLVERHESTPARSVFRWWQIPVFAAVAAAVAIVAMHRPAEQPGARVSKLLAESATAPLSGARRISMRSHGRMLVRPAVLTTDWPPADETEAARLRAVFVRARYDWDAPLSARAFQGWRAGLSQKKDYVGVAGESYVVRTETEAGILHSASLTLRAKDLHPTNGLLKFEGEGDVELAEAPDAVESARRPPPPVVHEPPAKTPAGPEDTLRVLEALNRIGADVGEPIEVSEDPQGRQVIVRASGLTQARQQEVAQELRGLPRVAVDFQSASASAPAAAKGTPENYSASIPTALRQRFEERLGGPIALQQVTDDVIEASASVLARAHAVQVLADKFPPETAARLSEAGQERLRDMRRRHVAALADLAARIRAELKPVLTLSDKPAGAGAPELVAAARNLDQLLNHLLAGSYSEASGLEMLRRVGGELDRLDAAIQSQRTGER